MDTLLTTSPEEAAAFIRRGELAAFPTETVYGLGADAFNERAVRTIFVAKGRPSDNPLIVHVVHLDQVGLLAEGISPAAQTLIDHFFPGPLTVILPKRPEVPSVVTGGLDTVGIRMPSHPIAQPFLDACETPVAAPSANRSGRPSPTTWRAVYEDLNGRIACILQGDRSDAGVESTVVDCTADVPVVLRAGVISLEQLRAVLPNVDTAASVRSEPARSPGTKYRHYAPQARVQLVDRPEQVQPGARSAYIGRDLPPNAAAFELVNHCEDVAHYAHDLFDFFRRCDAAGLHTIYCQTVEPTGLGLALMDRLRRAAQP